MKGFRYYQESMEKGGGNYRLYFTYTTKGNFFRITLDF